MRSRTSLPALLVGLSIGLLSAAASASPHCDLDDERADRREDTTERAAADPVVESVAFSGGLEELIIPCAMAESDQLGPWCVDATVYLVTTSGTLLCRVTLPAVDLATSSSPDLEDRDPAPAPHRVPLEAPAGSLASALKDAAKPLVREHASLHDRSRLPPSPVYAEPPFVPG